MKPTIAVLSLAFVSCSGPGNPAPVATATAEKSAPAATASVSATAVESAAPAAPPLDPDGDDDLADTGAGPFPESLRFERVGKAPKALWRICDLTPFEGALYAAHAYIPLDMDGATVSRFDPRTSTFTVAFDWNRPGEPARNGGAGQGFLRVHAIGGRLYVPDADPPYNGFEITEPGTEGYVFVSDPHGAFAPPKMPHHKLPDAPTPEGGAGAGILPRAYHVLDVIRYHGRLYASTGSVPPSERAWHGASPGALHAATPDLSRWIYEVDYPNPWQDGVWRLTYLVRFKGRLYAGIQDYEGIDPNDYVYFDPPASEPRITQKYVHPVRVTEKGGARTLRWYADGGKLYWIARDRGGVRLRVSEDGDTWRLVSFPRNAGSPGDVTRYQGVVVALTERGLYRLDRDPPEPVARVASQDGRSPFEVHDFFCAPPLAVLDGVLYAGAQRDGSLYRLVP
jgi:hypothetical protein